MIDLPLLFATFLAGFIYTISPGPAFLALFSLGAARGRVAGGWFMTGHLIGDVAWSMLALAAIVGVSQVGPTLFDCLGIACGLYLIYLGMRAVMAGGLSRSLIMAQYRTGGNAARTGRTSAFSG